MPTPSAAKADFNAEHRQAGMVVGVLATLDGALRAVTGPVEGCIHDSDAYTLARPDGSWPTIGSSPTSLSGHSGDPALPQTAGQQVPYPEDTILNTGVSRIGWAVGHTIARVENRKVLAGGHRVLPAGFPTVIRLVTTFECHRCGW